MKPSFRVLVALPAVIVTSGAFAHARLMASEPANGASVAAPAAVTLHYNEAVEPAMSHLKLVGPDTDAVELPKPTVPEGDAKTLIGALPKLAAGSYRLQWSTMGHDGHHTHGEVRFSVK